jgi:hypothetical protein
MTAGDDFTKTWRLKNNGTCTWTSGYQLVFDHGDAMGGPSSVPLTSGTVAPGQTIDISVDLTAPSKPGAYQGYWKLRNPSGVLFGWGSNADSAFWVKIQVEAAAGQPPPQPPPANPKKKVSLSPTSNGGSVASNGDSSLGYAPGDDVWDHAWVAFFDFDLTNIPPTATIQAATLDLPCVWVAGDPLNELGELAVFYSYYGTFSPAVLSQSNYPLTEHLGSLLSCPDAPLDVTSSLQANLGPPYYQVVVLFQFPTDANADDDYIEITAPLLVVEYTP